MANEITLITKTSVVTAAGAYSPSQTITKTLDQTGTNVGSFTQNVTSTDAIIDIPGSVTGDRWVEINSLDAKDVLTFIKVSTVTGGGFDAAVFAKIPAAGVLRAVIPSAVNWYLETDSGTMQVDVRCFQV
jgi:hypothetical protein